MYYYLDDNGYYTLVERNSVNESNFNDKNYYLVDSSKKGMTYN